MPSRKRDRGESNVEEGTRKRVKPSATPEPHAHAHLTQPAVDMTSHQETHTAAPTQTLLASSFQLLRGDLEDLRQVVTCKICERLLYEPYVLSCGHTYCYSCLSTWFATSRKKTCPGCREVITQPPAPSYVIKEMTNIFVRRPDFMPEGETVEQHVQWGEEEAELVRKDKDDGGLFKDAFHPPRARNIPVRDDLDGVERCPRCHWEIDDGMCLHCGVHMDRDSDSFSGTDYEVEADQELDELDAELEVDVFDLDLGAYRRHDADHPHFDPSDTDNSQAPPRRQSRPLPLGMFQRGVRPRAVYGDDDDEPEDDDDEDDEEDDDTGSLDDFIDDRDPVDITTHTISSPEIERTSRGRLHHIVPSSDEDEEEGEETYYEPIRTYDHTVRNRNRNRNRNHIHPRIIVSSDDDDDGEVIATTTSRAAPRVPVYEVSDDDESDAPRAIGNASRGIHSGARGIHHGARALPTVRSYVATPHGWNVGGGGHIDDDNEESGSESDATPGVVREMSDSSSSSSSINSDSPEEHETGHRHGGRVQGGDLESRNSWGRGFYDDVSSVGATRSSSHDDNGFSPMQNTDEDQQEGLDHYNVYGEVGDSD